MGAPAKRSLVAFPGPTAALLAGCGGGAPPTPPPAAVAPAAPAPVVRPKEPDSGKALLPIAYEPKGRRDPVTPSFLGRDNASLSVSAPKLPAPMRTRAGLTALFSAPEVIGYISTHATPPTPRPSTRTPPTSP